MKATTSTPYMNPAMVQYWSYLAEEWEKIGKPDEAMGYYRRAYSVSTALYGERHFETKLLSRKIKTLQINGTSGPPAFFN